MSTEPTKKPTPFAFDTRVLERNLADGTITREDLERHLAALPDVSEKGEPFMTRLSGHEYDEPEADEQGEEG